MPAIVIPRRQLVQPQGYARVADGSWMTYLPSAGINSLLDGRSLSNSGVALAIGNSGVAADIDAAADYLEYTPTTDIPDSFHLVAVVDLNASSTFSRLIQSGDSSGYERFFIWFAPSTSSGSVGNPNSVVIGRNISPSILGERWSTAANSLVRPRSGVVLEVIWGATASDTTAPQVWINGVEQTVTKVQSSASFNADFDTLSGAPLRIGNRFGSVDRGLLGKLYLLHVEQQSRIAPYINPWRLFKPSPRRLYFDVPAGSDEVQADTAIRWNMQAAVSTAASIRWSLQQPVQKDAAVRWSMLQPATAEAIARWSMLASVTKPQAIRWDLLEAVQQDRTVAWQLLQAAQADATLRWSMLEAVQADAAILWNLAETLGLVTSEFVARWSMLAPAQTDASVHWNLLQAVAADAPVRWDMLQSAERADAVRWSLLEAVRADRTLRWAMLGAVRADATAAWNLLQAVQVDASLRWDLITAGVVFSTFDVRWSMLAAVEKSVAARWSLLEALQVDAGLRWDMVSAVTAEALVRWDLLASAQVVTDAVIRWDVLSASQRDVVIRWRIGDASTLTPINVHLVPAERRLFVVPPENRITVVAPARGTPFTTH